MTNKYILQGREVVPVDDLFEWARRFESADRKVARDEALSGVEVSTVFLGIDHQFRPGGPPLLFETMVFGGVLDQAQERCSTWEEAERQHAAMILRVLREREPGT